VIDIVVREADGAWKVECGEALLLQSPSEEHAVKHALGEASRSFEAGKAAQVIFKLEQPLV
jgi:hypothetical protein